MSDVYWRFALGFADNIEAWILGIIMKESVVSRLGLALKHCKFPSFSFSLLKSSWSEDFWVYTERPRCAVLPNGLEKSLLLVVLSQCQAVPVNIRNIVQFVLSLVAYQSPQWFSTHAYTPNLPQLVSTFQAELFSTIPPLPSFPPSLSMVSPWNPIFHLPQLY